MTIVAGHAPSGGPPVATERLHSVSVVKVGAFLAVALFAKMKLVKGWNRGRGLWCCNGSQELAVCRLSHVSTRSLCALPASPTGCTVVLPLVVLWFSSVGITAASEQQRPHTAFQLPSRLGFFECDAQRYATHPERGKCVLACRPLNTQAIVLSTTRYFQSRSLLFRGVGHFHPAPCLCQRSLPAVVDMRHCRRAAQAVVLRSRVHMFHWSLTTCGIFIECYSF